MQIRTMGRTFQRLALVAIGVCALVTVLSVGGVSASASGTDAKGSNPSEATALVAPVNISYFDCDTGSSRIICTLSIADGTPSFGITWTVNGQVQPQFENQTLLRIGCIPGRSFNVQVTVVDAVGSTASDGTGGVCSRYEQ